MSKNRRILLTVSAAATLIVAAAIFLLARDRGVTEPMVTQVHTGMTQRDVEAILGKPQEVRSATATVAGKSRTSAVCTWAMRGKGRVVVTFEEDRVTTVER